jgi:uncharacterized membrane protein (DUF4010 family)
VSVASLETTRRITAGQAIVPVLTALSTNTLTKMVLAFTGGSRAFALYVVPGLVLVVAAAWLGTLVPLPG